MSKLIDSNNHATNFGFSSKGQSTSRTLPSGQIESFGYDSRQRQNLHISFEGVHKVTVYDDSVSGGGRVAGYDLFASAADYNAYMADGTDAGTEPDGNLAAGVKWERIRMTYDAFGRTLTTSHIYATGATAGLPTTTLQTDTWTNSYDRGDLCRKRRQREQLVMNTMIWGARPKSLRISETPEARW